MFLFEKQIKTMVISELPIRCAVIKSDLSFLPQQLRSQEFRVRKTVLSPLIVVLHGHRLDLLHSFGSAAKAGPLALVQ